MRQHLWRTLLLVLVLTLLLTGCGDPSLSALNPQGPVADDQFSLIKLSIFIMLLVITVVTLIFIYVLIRFRQRPGDDHIPEQVEGSVVLETVWTVIPIVLLIILAVPTVMTTFSLAEPYPDVETSSAEAAEDGEAVQQTAEDAPLRIKVTAYQFWWQFEYPDHGIVTAQDLYIPTGERVYFELTSEDVIHSFWVPALGGKMDTNPGLVNEMFLEADKPGVYQGRCTELCGASHALMDFKVIALEPAEFDQWLASMSDYDGEKAESTQAEQGRDVFADNCISCHAVDGQTPSLGPNLAGIADRETIAGYLPNDAQTLEDWIRHPDELKEESAMPAFADMSDEDMDALIEYLQGLTISE